MVHLTDICTVLHHRLLLSPAVVSDYSVGLWSVISPYYLHRYKRGKSSWHYIELC